MCNVDQKLTNALREKDKNNHISGRGRLGKRAFSHRSVGGEGRGEWGQSEQAVVRKKGMSWHTQRFQLRVTLRLRD